MPRVQAQELQDDKPNDKIARTHRMDGDAEMQPAALRWLANLLPAMGHTEKTLDSLSLDVRSRLAIDAGKGQQPREN